MFSHLFASWSPAARIALGQSSLLVTILLVAVWLGVVPDRNSAILEGRAAVAEVAALNSSILITRSDLRRIDASLQLLVRRHEDILSGAVVREDGSLLSSVGEHPGPGERGTETRVPGLISVPVYQGERDWGRVELRFEPLLGTGWRRIIQHPLAQLLGFVGVFGFLGFYLYLRRMLKMLDPNAAIPDRVRSALDTMAEGLLVLDAKQNIMLANSAFAEIAGQAPEKLLGQQVSGFPWEFGEESPFGIHETPWGLALDSCESQLGHMVHLKTAEGPERTFMTNSSPIMAGADSISGVLVSFDDVSELKEIEAELRSSKEEAEMANRAKSNFLANMSHEIRTPMNAIMGFTEVLKRGYGHNRESSHKHLDTISRSSAHLLGLINDVLDLSKVEAGRMEIEMIPCAIHQVVREVIEVMQVKASEKGLFLRYEPEGPQPAEVLSDPAKLRQILTNLIGNAVKFTEKGGVAVVSRVKTEGGESTLQLDVVDTGIGMTREQTDNVFEAFTQADSSVTRKYGGTGLGLSISKSFAQGLGGDILVSSEAGKGSVFSTTIALGVLAADTEWLEPAEILAKESALKALPRISWEFPASHILVVDDGTENRELLQLVLEDHGLRVSTAENGAQAVDMVRQQTFDFILMDVQMPIMDGYTAVAHMREQGLDTPIVALTAEAMQGAEQKCLDAGYSGYHSKPIDIDKLLEMLAAELGGTPGSQVVDALQGDSQEQLAEPLAACSAAPDLIVSSLQAGNPAFRSIAEKFVLRLAEQMKAMRVAWQQGDMKELARLAHWLKGSAGSVGYHPFTEPARELENLARDARTDGISELFETLEGLQSRVSVDGSQGDPVENDVILGQVSREFDIPDAIRSSLDDGGPKFQSIIERFTNSLDERLDAMEKALLAGDAEALQRLAHWLTGSAGSVGFNLFTQPAADLETFARSGKLGQARDCVELLREMSRRIVQPGRASMEA